MVGATFIPMTVILIISIVLSFILSLTYKVFTNQEKAKEMKERIAELRKKIEEAQKKKNQTELMKYQNEMLKISSEQMRATTKPMIISFIIIIPIFFWLLPSLYGNLDIELNDSHVGVLKYGAIEENVSLMQENPLLIKIDDEKKSLNDVIVVGDKKFVLQKFDKNKNVITLKRDIVDFPFSMPFWGSHIGWLGWYILVSFPMTTIFRRLLGVVQ
ncbi:MAG: DUF106 domain-containing protein [Candidatus Aenigmarchaeota archaeon]|nr:DUF106 domain-containing protein [Candidatus Aenigmarchaeota archaeon]